MSIDSKKRIIYIIGLGRSGTTLLDVIMGNLKDTFSCGELNRYVYEEGVPYQFPTSHPSYLFWMDIKSQMDKEYSSLDYRQLRKYSRRYDYHTGFLGNYFNLNNGRHDFQELLKFNIILYKKIFDSSNSEILIDSSKYSNRALFLSNNEEFDVHYIYIKRDPIEVVRSFGKTNVEQGRRNWFSANLYYFVGSLLCQLAVNKLRAKGMKVSAIKHSEVLRNSSATFNKIEMELGISMKQILNRITSNEPFKVGNLYYGNRVRLKETVILGSETARKMKFSDFLTRIINNIWY